MPNRVHLISDECVEVYFVGDQTEKTVQSLLVQSDQLLTKRGVPESKMNFLVNLSGIGKTTARARVAASQAMRTRSFRRIGVFGSSIYVKYLATLVISASHKQSQVRYFNDQTEALDWVCQSD